MTFQQNRGGGGAVVRIITLIPDDLADDFLLNSAYVPYDKMMRNESAKLGVLFKHF